MKFFLSILIGVLYCIQAYIPATEYTCGAADPFAVHECNLQQNICSNQLHSDAVEGTGNSSLQRIHGEKNTTFQKYSLKEKASTNRCGVHLSSMSLLHNSLPAITVSHKHILVLERLTI